MDHCCKICLQERVTSKDECKFVKLRLRDMVPWDSWDQEVVPVKIVKKRCPQDRDYAVMVLWASWDPFF